MVNSEIGQSDLLNSSYGLYKWFSHFSVHVVVCRFTLVILYRHLRVLEYTIWSNMTVQRPVEHCGQNIHPQSNFLTEKLFSP